MAKSLRQTLKAEEMELKAEGLKIMEKGDERSAEDGARLTAIAERLGALAPQIAKEEQLAELLRSAPAPSAGSGSVSGMRDLAAERPFATLGEQLQAVAVAAMPGGQVDARLYGASGLSSGVGSDGGFLVQKDFTTALLEGAMAESVLAPLCREMPIGPNSDGVEAPYIDETSRANGSRWGGVRVYRRGEAETVTATKPAFGKFDLRLEDLMGIAYATERVIRDATTLEGILTEAFSAEFGFKIDDEIIRGTGAGEALGVLGSGALVSVPKESGQAADTIVAQNVMKMRSRTWSRSRSRGVWVINQDVEPQLQQMAVTVGTGGVPVYLPASGLSTDGYDRLYGRPVIPLEQAATLGDLGDMMFLDLSQYILIRKGGVEAQQSIHVRFLYNERAFRWVVPINGAPKWKSPLTPYKGTANTVSPFVAIAERA